MNANLLNVLKEISAQYGEDVLGDAQRVKAFFSDLAKDDPKSLRTAFCCCIEAGAYAALKNAPEPAERAFRKTVIAQRLRDEHGLDPAISAEALDILEAAIFKTAGAAQESQSAPEPNPENTVQVEKPPYYEKIHSILAQYQDKLENAATASPSVPVTPQPYQQPAPYQPPPGVIKKRSLAGMSVLSFITLGCFKLYWVDQLAKDVNAICAGDGKKTSGEIPYFFLNLITLGIYGLVWVYKLGNRLRDNAPRYNLTFKQGGGVVLGWLIFGLCIIVGPFIAWYIIIKNTNALADAYNTKCAAAL